MDKTFQNLPVKNVLLVSESTISVWNAIGGNVALGAINKYSHSLLSQRANIAGKKGGKKI